MGFGRKGRQIVTGRGKCALSLDTLPKVRAFTCKVKKPEKIVNGLKLFQLLDGDSFFRSMPTTAVQLKIVEFLTLGRISELISC